MHAFSLTTCRAPARDCTHAFSTVRHARMRTARTARALVKAATSMLRTYAPPLFRISAVPSLACCCACFLRRWLRALKSTRGRKYHTLLKRMTLYRAWHRAGIAAATRAPYLSTYSYSLVGCGGSAGLPATYHLLLLYSCGLGGHSPSDYPQRRYSIAVKQYGVAFGIPALTSPTLSFVYCLAVGNAYLHLTLPG